MTKQQEIMTLMELQYDLMLNGKIKREDSETPFECKEDYERLKKHKLFDLQDKYAYGWYIAMTDTLEGQVSEIWEFIRFIMSNYKEDTPPVNITPPDKTIMLRSYASSICDIFEEILEKHNIAIPSDDRNGDESEASLYGTEYYTAEEHTIKVLTELVNDVKNNPYGEVNTTEY